VCDSRTVNLVKDLVASDTVFANENMLVHYDENQQWFYISDQMPDELLLFRQADSSDSPRKTTNNDYLHYCN